MTEIEALIRESVRADIENLTFNKVIVDATPEEWANSIMYCVCNAVLHWLKTALVYPSTVSDAICALETILAEFDGVQNEKE